MCTSRLFNLKEGDNMIDFSDPKIYNRIAKIMELCDSKDFQPKVDNTPDWLQEIRQTEAELNAYMRTVLNP